MESIISASFDLSETEHRVGEAKPVPGSLAEPSMLRGCLHDVRASR